LPLNIHMIERFIFVYFFIVSTFLKSPTHELMTAFAFDLQWILTVTKSMRICISCT
ncbi:hypothetical protein L9F63_007360, partial [Diploptera punctata]